MRIQTTRELSVVNTKKMTKKANRLAIPTIARAFQRSSHARRSTLFHIGRKLSKGSRSFIELANKTMGIDPQLNMRLYIPRVKATQTPKNEGILL